MSEPKQTMEALVENTGEAPSAGSPEATAKNEKKKPDFKINSEIRLLYIIRRVEW